MHPDLSGRAGPRGEVMALAVVIIIVGLRPPNRVTCDYLKLHVNRVLEKAVSSGLSDKHILGKGSLLPNEGPWGRYFEQV